jgi:hypothetical protein
MTVEQWLAIRKKAAVQIDPETAEFFWEWGSVLDPYGVCESLPEDNCGRSYFARSPGTDDWVSFHDLPATTVKRLWERISNGELRDCEESLPWMT